MRDRPGFDDLEAPPPSVSRIDGLTDEEWAARRLRSERRSRILFGLPEWNLLERMPWWMIGALAAALFIVTVLFGMILVLGRIPSF